MAGMEDDVVRVSTMEVTAEGKMIMSKHQSKHCTHVRVRF